MTDNARFWSKTPWRPLPDIVHAVCIRHFDAAGPDDLTLQLGDELYITEVNGTDNQWCRGWLLAHASILNPPSGQPRAYAGIFPRCCVSVREVLGEQKEQKANGHLRKESLPSDFPRAPSPAGTMSPRASASRLKRQDSPLAPLVPRHVSPRSHGEAKEPAPLPTLQVGDGGRSEPLIDDISSTIREWHSSKLQDLASRREYARLNELSEIADRLYIARRQLAMNLLTEKETIALREQVVWDLVRGNKMVEGEVIVRNAAQNGRKLTAQDPLPDLADLQTVMSLRDRPVATRLAESHLSHLLMQVKTVPQKLPDPALLHMGLYAVSSSSKPKPISEAFAVELAIAEETGRVEIADSYQDTLFKDLSKTDTGGGDQSDSRLYLVCRLIQDEPMHAPPTPSLPSSPALPSGEFEESPGRRMSWARTGSRKVSEPSERPRPTTATSQATNSTVSRSLSTSQKSTHTTSTITERPESAKKVRRVVGWSAISVSSLIRDCASGTKSLSFWVPSTPESDHSSAHRSGEDGWDDVIKSMARSASGRFTKIHGIDPLVIQLTGFAHPDATELITRKPALLKGVHCTPAISLNGASTKPRSDVYLTIREPVFPRGGKFFHPQQGAVPLSAKTDLLNLQVTLEVRKSNGDRIDDAIHPTGNRQPHTAFRSPAIEKGEAWNQTIRLSISPEDLPEAHIIMSVADGAGFPFALAWLPLWNRVNGFPSDGQQNLALWDYCEYTANLIDGRGAYQSLPSRVEEMPDLKVTQMASIAVETHLSSTNATQNADVLAFSNLDHISQEEMTALLGRFTSIPDEEIAKFFGPILVSLDGLLERSSWDELDRSVSKASTTANRSTAAHAVSCMAHTVRLIHDRRFLYLQSLLDNYLARRKTSIEAGVSILRALQDKLLSGFDARNGRELRAYLKVADLLLKFAVVKKPDEESDRIREHMGYFMENVGVLLSKNSHLALPSQVIVVQNIHHWVPELLTTCSGEDVLKFIANAADACAREHSPLWLHRLSMIHNIFANPAFQEESLRTALVGLTEQWLSPVWPLEPPIDETGVAAVRLSVSIVKQQQPFMDQAQRQRYIHRLFSVFNLVHESKTPAPSSTTHRRRGFSPLFQTTHPFSSVSTTAAFIPSEVLLEISAVLGAFFQAGDAQVSNGHVPPIVDYDQEQPDLAAALSVIRALQASAAFPPSWLSLYVSMSRCTVTMLAWVLSHLSASLPDETEVDGEAILDFDETLWTQWFEALITLVTSDVVRMEDHSEQKRRAVWAIGGDIREDGAILLKKAWNSLGWTNDPDAESLYGISRMGGYQVQFISELIPSVVSLGLSLHYALRTVAVDILKSMIVGEWELSGELDVIRCALIDALDKAFRDSKFEPHQAKMLLETVQQRLEYLVDSGATKLHGEVGSMLTELHTIVEVLTKIRDCASDDAMRLQYRVLMLEHLRTANNEDSYLRNIHDIAEFQVKTNNFSSAALAMQLHVELLKRHSDPEADSRLAKAYPELQLPSQTLYQRKQMLYATMTKLFRKGCCWSKVLSTLETQKQEMLAAYDTVNIKSVLHEQAETHQRLSSGKGMSMPRYFRVAFSEHQEFPASVMGRAFIFEALPDDGTSQFAQRLKQSYPSATVIHSGVTSSSSTQETPKIHIISVHVNREHLHPVNLRAGVSPFFRLHTLTQEPDIFSNSTRQQKPGLSVAQQTVAKNIYVTAEQFPTILGRSEIIREEAQMLTAAQAASDRVHRKTMDLTEELMKANPASTDEDDKLIELIKASVDPTSVDSVAAYHELLLEDDEDSQYSGHAASTASGVNGNARGSRSSRGGADDKHSKEAYLRVLTVALRDHAQMLEHTLATAFGKRPGVKAKLRGDLQLTFEPELHSLYPNGDWSLHSPAWAEPRSRTTHPAVRGESLFSDLGVVRTHGIPVAIEMSGANADDENNEASEAPTIAQKRFEAEGSRPASRMSRRGLGSAESDTETEGKWRGGLRRRLSLRRRQQQQEQ